MSLITVNPLWFLALLLISVAWFLWWLRERALKMKYFDSLGLRGPPTDVIFGNFKQMNVLLKELAQTNDTRHFASSLIDEYGTTMRFCLGADLQIVTVDSAVIKEVFLSKFSKFTDRPAAFFNRFPLGESVLAVSKAGWPGRNYGWKEIRGTVAQTFRPSRVKMMFPAILGQVRLLMSVWEEKLREDEQIVLNIHEEYQFLTVDVICRCAFGLVIDSVKDRCHPFFMACTNLFREFTMDKSWGMYLSMFLPTIASYMHDFTKLGKCALVLGVHIKQLVQNRMKDRNPERIDIIENFLQENDKLVKEQKTPFHIDTIISNCFAILLAGYDTTSNSMTYGSYLLARHPECAQKLRKEMEQILCDKDLNYDALMKAPYLDAFFRETLRFYPPIAFFANRLATEDVYLESVGVHLPKGTTVVAPIQLCCSNRDVWEDPDLFRPERFLESTTPISTTEWMVFGTGPRNCAGLLFAEVEFKVAIVEMARRFQLKSLAPIKMGISSVLIRPQGPVPIRIRKL